MIPDFTTIHCNIHDNRIVVFSHITLQSLDFMQNVLRFTFSLSLNYNLNSKPKDCAMNDKISVLSSI